MSIPITGYLINTFWNENVYRDRGDRRRTLYNIIRFEGCIFSATRAHYYIGSREMDEK